MYPSPSLNNGQIMAGLVYLYPHVISPNIILRQIPDIIASVNLLVYISILLELFVFNRITTL